MVRAIGEGTGPRRVFCKVCRAPGAVSARDPSLDARANVCASRSRRETRSHPVRSWAASAATKTFICARPVRSGRSSNAASMPTPIRNRRTAQAISSPSGDGVSAAANSRPFARLRPVRAARASSSIIAGICRRILCCRRARTSNRAAIGSSAPAATATAVASRFSCRHEHGTAAGDRSQDAQPQDDARREARPRLHDQPVEATVDPRRDGVAVGRRIRFRDADDLRKFRTRLDPQSIYRADHDRLALLGIVDPGVQFARDEEFAGDFDAERRQARERRRLRPGGIKRAQDAARCRRSLPCGRRRDPRSDIGRRKTRTIRKSAQPSARRTPAAKRESGSARPKRCTPGRRQRQLDARHGDQELDSIKRIARVVGVERAHRAVVSGVHRLQQFEHLAAARVPKMIRSGRSRRLFLSRSRSVTSPLPRPPP